VPGSTATKCSSTPASLRSPSSRSTCSRASSDFFEEFKSAAPATSSSSFLDTSSKVFREFVRERYLSLVHEADGGHVLRAAGGGAARCVVHRVRGDGAPHLAAALPLPRLGRRCICIPGIPGVTVLRGLHGERHLLLLPCRPSALASTTIRCSDGNPTAAMAPLRSSAATSGLDLDLRIWTWEFFIIKN
jgi:hypothetical protein